jgi:hypothetical protein
MGLSVVSGLARGIDTAAHAGSIENGTVAVIAGGIDVVYPPENRLLQEAIAERGLLIAEQPPGTEPRARHFPYRNRSSLVLRQVPWLLKLRQSQDHSLPRALRRKRDVRLWLFPAHR